MNSNEFPHGTTQSPYEKNASDGELFIVQNAGLALLHPYLRTLFQRLGFLSSDRNSFRDTDSQIRAIFVMQKLVTQDEREYSEHELAFNRIFVGYPFSASLPKRLELIANEKDFVQRLLEAVKDNWSQLKNTSIEGFQRTFLEREARLEQKNDKWLLTVAERSYDVLLDTIPWGYKRINVPWLKEDIEVIWH